MALLAAALFGISTPLVQRFGAGLGAFSTAALLYAGAAAMRAQRRLACCPDNALSAMRVRSAETC